jgi:hypothetical protein
MSSDETLAVGAAYICAAQRNALTVLKVRQTSFANCNITLVHQERVQQLFGRTSSLAAYESYSFAARDNAPLAIIADGVPLSTIRLELPDGIDGDTSVTVVFRFDELTLPQVLRVLVNGSVAAINHTKEYPDWALTAGQFEESSMLISRMEAIVEERRTLQRLQNDYESFMLRFTENLEFDANYKAVVNETIRKELADVIAAHKEWLHGEHHSPLNESVIQLKFDELKNATGAVSTRAEEFGKRPIAWQKLNASLNHVLRSLGMTWPVLKPWLTEEQTRPLWSQYNRTREWFDERYARQLNQSVCDELTVTVAEIETQKMQLELAFNETNMIPRPAARPPPSPSPPPTASPTQ